MSKLFIQMRFVLVPALLAAITLANTDPTTLSEDIVFTSDKERTKTFTSSEKKVEKKVLVFSSNGNPERPDKVFSSEEDTTSPLNVEEVQTCVVDEDCTDYPWFKCGVKVPGICSHKKVFPVENLEIGGLFVFTFIMALSNVAGVGGGGVAIPIVMSMFHFTTKPAIAISSFSIFATTIARFILNFKEKHPEKENVVSIDYDLVAIMMPTTLAGAQIGALILVSFPSLYIQVILTLMLLFLAIQSLQKAIKMTRQENAAKDKAKTAPIAIAVPQSSEAQNNTRQDGSAADINEANPPSSARVLQSDGDVQMTDRALDKRQQQQDNVQDMMAE